MAPIINDRDLALQASPYRFAITAVSITSSAGAFKTFKNGGITSPANIVLTATPNVVFTAAAVYTWSYALSTQPATWIALTTGSTATITNSSILAILGESTSIQYRCVVTENLLNTASGFFTITYSKEVSEPILVDITRTNAAISSDSAGVPIGYSNTDTTISVSRGGVALAYSASGGINTFKVDIQADNVARTVGTISSTANTYSISGITNITVDIATVIFIVTVYDASGIVVSPTIGKRITYTKVTNGAVGGDATYSYIETSAPVISKSTSAASITGTHSNITVTGKRVVGSGAPTTYGFLTVTANGDVEATLATANSITTAINNSAGKTSYSIKLYNQATVSGATLLDIDNVPVLFTGSSAIIVALTNDSSTVPTNSAGTAGIYTGTGTEIHAYEGALELSYDGIGTANGTWKIASTLQSNITIGSITDSGLFATIGAASNIVGDTAAIGYTISGVSLGGIAFSQLQTQSFSRAYAGATGTTGATGASGTNGANGTKAITISAFKWGTSIGTFAQAATYTWGGSISAYPVGWTSAAPASTANGETLFQINLTITAIATDTTTAVNWSTAVSNTIGYRLDGTIGPQGNSARVAYIVTTSGTPPATPTALAGDQAPTGWSFAATSVLTAGQFMYQSDGILVTGGNIAWGIPYLSNLKVGSLSALSADIGTLNISSTGSIASLSPVTPFTTRKSYGTGNVPGVFLGYDSTTYKFDIGSDTNFLRWTGTTLETQGLIIRNTAGTVILSSGTLPTDINNSAITISAAGNLSGAGGGKVTIGGLGYTGDLNATAGADWATNVTGATAVNNSITTAQNTLIAIASDSVLSMGEKPAVILQYSVITNEQGNFNSQADAANIPHTAYDGAISALQVYLGGLAPQWDLITVDTPIVGTTFRQKFLDVNLHKQALITAISSKTTARLTTRANLVYNGGFENGLNGWIGNTASVSVTDGLWGRCVVGQGISGTGVITQNTLFTVQANEWYTVTGDSLFLNATSGYVYFDIEWLTGAQVPLGDSTQGIISILHDFSVGETSRSAHAVNVQAPATAAYGRVRFVWGDVVGSAIVGCRQIKVERGQLPATPYSSDATLPVLQANANLAKTTADTAIGVLDRISSDGYLSKGEKPAVILEYNAIIAEYPQIQSQGDSLGIVVGSAIRNNFDSTVSALQSYIASLSPSYSDTTTDTVIVGTTFRQKFVDYYSNKQTFLNAIAAKAATLATWAGVTGTGRPEDNATVGANTNNLNVGIGLGNKLSNSGPYPGSLSGFVFGYDSTGKTRDPIRASYEPWRPTGQGGVYLHFAPENTPATGTLSDINEGDNKRYQVLAGQKYEASVYLSTHRCTAFINIAWFTAAGVYISEEAGNSIVNNGASNALVNWPRSVLITTAPANAALASVYVRSSYNGTSDPYTFASMWYFAAALPSQTVASPWSDSVDPTVIATANAAKALADSSAITIGNITSDNVLSKGEKSKAIAERQAIDNDYAGINSQASTLGISNAAYINRVQALQTYLTSLSPAWNDVNSDTPIDGPTFRQKFLEVHYERQQLLNRIAANTYSRLTTRANLLYNGGFENGFNGWVGSTALLGVSDGVWGRAAIGFNITGTGVIGQNTFFAAQPSETYTVTGDSLLLNATAGGVYFDIEWLTGASVVISDSTQSPLTTNHDFSTGETTRLAHAVNVVAPANAAYGRVRFVWESITGTNVIVGARQIKVERGVLPATPYSADATLPVLQSSANAAKATADASAITIGNITSDNVLSKGEKSAAIAEYQALADAYAGIVTQADNLGVSRTAYTGQQTALQNYLNSLSPTWNDTNSDTPIVGTTFRQRFLDVHYAKQLVLNAIAAKAATLADWSSVTGTGKPENNATVGANTSNLNVGIGLGNRLSNSGPHVDSISGFVFGYDSTGKPKDPITASFAPYRPLGQGGVYLHYTATNTPAAGTLSDINEGNNKRYQVIAGQRYEASVYLSTIRCAAYINIAWFNDAGTYLGEQAGNNIDSLQVGGALINWPRSVLITTAPAGAALASVYVRSAYNGTSDPYTFASMWYFATALPSQTVASPWSDSVDPTVIATANSAKALADASTAAIGNITSDNILSKGEKSKAIAEYQAIDNDYAGIVNQADGLGISRTAFVNRVSDLQNYLNSLSPSWNDVNQDTPIVGSTFRQRFLDTHYERQQLLNAIVARAAITATWANVTGAGRPQDGATVGATFGSNISGKITNANASTFIDSAAINNAQIGTLDAQKINTGFLSADRLLAGSITAEKINIGSGKNLLRNSTWIERLGGTGYAPGTPRSWDPNTNAVGPSIVATPANHPDWCPIGMDGVDMYQGSVYTAGAVIYLTTLVSVVPNKRYEFSVYSGAHRAETYTQNEWLDIYGNLISYSSDLRITNDEAKPGGKSLIAFKQIGHFGVAPANAVQARFYIIKLSTKEISGYLDSHAFLVAPMVSEALPNQTVFSSYSPAGLNTRITGSGIETNAITADKISVGSLSAVSAILGTVTAGKITGSSFATDGFTDYDWPTNVNQGGAYVDYRGALFGNARPGATMGYLQISADGSIRAPNFTIINGNANFGGTLTAASGTFRGSLTADAVNAVNTINIAGNAVTVPVANSGAYNAQISADAGTGTLFHLLGTFVQGTGRSSLPVRMFANGNQVAAEFPIQGTIGVLSVQFYGTGICTFRVAADNDVGDMRCTILALGAKR